MKKIGVTSISILALIAITVGALQPGYPKEWWEPVPREQAASWEVLPQDAGPGEVILSKRNELGILSNFAPTPFDYRGKRYGSVEGFWQSTKYPEGPNDPRLRDPRGRPVVWPYTRDQVAAMTAFDAKSAGSEAGKIMRELGITWVTVEGQRMEYLENAKGAFYQHILAVEWAKLNQNANVREVLLKTKGLRLLPDHHQSATSAPAWKYYDIWMEIRSQL